MSKIYNKLVRDKIPEIIKADGKKANIRILENEEYLNELVKKLQEEAKEFEAEPSAEELADIQEIIIAIREAMAIHSGDLENIRRRKAMINGRFKKRIFLMSVEE